MNKILPHKPELNEELEVRNGVGVERHLGGLFLSKIGVFEDYKSKRFYLSLLNGELNDLLKTQNLKFDPSSIFLSNFDKIVHHVSLQHEIENSIFLQNGVIFQNNNNNNNAYEMLDSYI